MPFAGFVGKDSRPHLCLELRGSDAMNAEACIRSKRVHEDHYSRRGEYFRMGDYWFRRAFQATYFVLRYTPERRDLD